MILLITSLSFFMHSSPLCMHSVMILFLPLCVLCIAPWYCSSLAVPYACCFSTIQDWEWDDCLKPSGNAAKQMSFTCSVPLHLVYCQRHCFELGWSMWSLVTKLLRDSSLYECGTLCINLFIDRHLGYEKFYLSWIPQGHKQISLWWIAKWVVSFTFFFLWTYWDFSG